MNNKKKQVILLTRSDKDNMSVADKLLQKGVASVSWPQFTYKACELEQEAKNAIIDIKKYDVLVFTSQRSVIFFLKIYDLLHESRKALKTVKIICVGDKTSLVAKKNNLRVFAVPEESCVAGINKLELFKKETSLKILVPQAKDALYCWAESMTNRHHINTLCLYEKIPVLYSDDDVSKMLATKIDAVFFYSPSAVKYFLQNTGTDKGVLFLKQRITGVIGPTTATALNKKGVTGIVQADKASTDDLISKVLTYF